MALTSDNAFGPRPVRIPPPPRVLTRVREDCWRCADPLVAPEDCVRPFDGIADSDTRWLGGSPLFEVLGSIVVSNAVSMVNRFTIEQMSAKKLLHHENVLEDIWPTCGTRMARRADHDVPRLVPGPAAFPVPVGLCRNTPTDATRR
jgi:hypothetical protein